MAYKVASPLDGQAAWVICDYLITVAVSRLHLPGHVPPRVNQDDFKEIISLVLKGLPRPDY